MERFFYNQNYLGAICEISNGTCEKIGQGLVEANSNFEDVKFAQLNNGKILITTANGAFIFDPKTNAITEINAPLNNMVPITLSTLNNGKVIGCRFNPNNNITQCQVYDADKQSWEYMASTLTLFSGEELRGGGFNLLTLTDGRVFFLDGYDNEVAKPQLYIPESDTWSALAPIKYSTFEIFYDAFVHSIQQPSENQVMVLTSKNEERNQDKFMLELYDLETENWFKTFQLPDFVEYIYNMIEIEPGAYLITYKGENIGEPKSATFYTE